VLSSGFFGQGFWQGIVTGLLISFILSGSAMAFYARIMNLAFLQRGVILSWFWLAVFFFSAIVVYSISQPKLQPPQIVVAPIAFPPATQSSWPPALTKAEIDNWSLALRPYHEKVTSVLIAFLDAGQKDFVTGLTQSISDAQWPEPSLAPGQLIVGVHIVASKDVFEAAQQLQTLLQPKLGTIRLDQIPERDKLTGKKTPTGFVAVYAGMKPQ
jgi:hypothetical protein